MATFAEPTMTLFDQLKADGVSFEMAANGLLFAALSRAAVEHEIQTLAPMRDHGYEISAEPLSFDRVHELAPVLGDNVQSGLFVGPERHIDPGSLLAGLRSRLDELGGRVLEGTAVEDFVVERGQVVGVRTSAETIEISAAVLAAGSWTGHLAAKLGARVPLQAGKGYSFSLNLDSPPPVPIYLVEAMVGCTPMHGVLRLAGTMDLSPVDGATNWRRIDAMKRSAADYLAPVNWEATTDHWMGMRPLTYDGMPVIGRLPSIRNAFVAAGHQMLGITLAPATGNAIARLAAGEDPPELRPFSPERFAK
jgi:D-amino-acid dehydrogenase